MFVDVGRYLVVPTHERFERSDRLRFVERVGVKAGGLALLPSAWTPPFFVVTSELYSAWKAADTEAQNEITRAVASEISSVCSTRWPSEWVNGLYLRSSSVRETLNERGAYDSLAMPADFGPEAIQNALLQIYESFLQKGGDGLLALIVQARVNMPALGHVSNERRVSKTINQWMWEADSLNPPTGRFNSQRAEPPEASERLTPITSTTGLIPLFRRVGRWCSQLELGRTHLEWGLSGGTLWLFQVDFEDDQPDDGEDPRSLLRLADAQPSGDIPLGSPFRMVDGAARTGWSKIDKVGQLTVGRSERYPRLYYLTGEQLAQAESRGYSLQIDIQRITHGRAVCRTDCVASGISRLNLPRTECVSAACAVDFMRATLQDLEARGATADQVCFIVHKFIPAVAAAWALAQPDKQVVLVDSLWGLPDGLQYLNHDTFEYDIRRNRISSETIRFKHQFLQEMQTGEWNLVRVSRNHVRSRSLTVGDLREVALRTHDIARAAGRPVQVMWFCDVAPEAGVGRNVPWFMMPADDTGKIYSPHSIAPGLRKVPIKTLADLQKVRDEPSAGIILNLEPEAELFRNDTFTDLVIAVSQEKNCPVAMTGSVLSHAFYKLERAGLSVVTATSGRTRTRQRQVFGKLVRDEIPAKITEHGEHVSLAHIPKEEARAALAIKLFEEAHELLAASTVPEVTGELADLLEVLRALCAATGIDWRDVETAADEKRRSRGGFEQNVVLLETSWPTWAGSLRQAQAATISLRELGRILSDGNDHVVTYPAAMVRGASNIVTLSDGSQISVSLEGPGIRVREVRSAPDQREPQLTFDFSRNEQSR